MIGHLTLKTNEPPHVASFYEQLPGQTGAKRKIKSDCRAARGVRPTQTSLGVIKPYDDNAATAGNAAMISLVVDSHAKVHAPSV
ncbi:MAG: hypothetical protein ING66_03460 [Rhodocyclaceae bacterium]|jgi:hypothetical protein|nr:hypothetical protein [Rhodocyclaceae bacterium]MCE2723310.1 hypothetical protein [Betaproteobacteria bacterium]MCA3021633.1 hypothetical protein [Rhodocyclaceae bacterium]MCA3027634.1 hypothetical protein [Rhodocyclaceae bacterium]MCA3035419.1 hypothetical protein [Rhodocyclaceae bacterium]